MDEIFHSLTDKRIEAEPSDFGFVQVGVVRPLAKNTIIYLHADKKNGVYKPQITIFSHGKQVKPMDDDYCFDLVKQAGMILCVRGMRFHSNGKPASFLVEIYRPQRVALRVVK